MAFTLSVQQMSHMPHNCVRADEFRLFIGILDPTREGYSLDEMSRQLLSEEILGGTFATHHRQVFHNFTSKQPSGLDRLPRGQARRAAVALHQARRRAYQAFFASKSAQALEALLSVAYNARSDWRRQWVETPRDLARFAVFAGLLDPGAEPGEYIPTTVLHNYRQQAISLAEILMEFRLPRTQGRGMTRADVSGGTRTFHSALILLDELGSFPLRLLAAGVSCLDSDDEVMEAATELRQRHERHRLEGDSLLPTAMEREADRFGLVLGAFLRAEGLVEDGLEAREVRISPSGRWLIQTDVEPRQAPTRQDNTSVREGQLKLRMHLSKERSPILARLKKRAVLAAGGKLACEVCGFVFADRYGALGEGVIECHHRIPLATWDGEQITRLEDLALVCANCHRMLHVGGVSRTPEELRALISSL